MDSSQLFGIEFSLKEIKIFNFKLVLNWVICDWSVRKNV
jgi:hypothetical protein